MPDIVSAMTSLTAGNSAQDEDDEFIRKKIVSEIDIDETADIGFVEFEHMLSRSSDFVRFVCCLSPDVKNT